MGNAKDSLALERYRQLLLQLGHVTDYVVWKRVTLEWMARELPGVSSRRFVGEMQKHVAAGGKIDQVVETRAEYLAYKFHFDLRLAISGRQIYVETVLDPEDESDMECCAIIVVSVHYA